MNRICLIAVCFMFSVALLSGCGQKPKGNTETAAGKVIEPSMLISKEDAKELTGVDFGEGVVTEQPVVGQKLCVYKKDRAFLQVGITQSAFMDKKSAKFGNSPESIYKTTKSAFKDAERIEGVGDDNFVAPPGLHILKDGYYVTISYGLGVNDREKLKAAGIKAVDNLKKRMGT